MSVLLETINYLQKQVDWKTNSLKTMNENCDTAVEIKQEINKIKSMISGLEYLEAVNNQPPYTEQDRINDMRNGLSMGMK